jgi:hypothetical protein
MGVIFFLIGLLIIWKSEIDADFNAIELLGFEKFLSCQEEIRIRHKTTVRKKLIPLLLHPPDKLIFYLANKKFKKEQMGGSEEDKKEMKR